ncbi:MAG: signal recognition particle-docking protein FtsY [Candidatus Lactobacillus pullistercoris]|uniref:Signal recognition particle receptor FtsY n=1 Tax=Candidatus Lactobacillus pullistercoris TaxID=2838636 RepID=A0A9E2KQW5_9LACO|nr:signal recognition particle-docking protein FtsY [Candidatus Lactobacillus pullistercoris]
MGLFDKIKKSLFGNLDEDQEEKEKPKKKNEELAEDDTILESNAENNEEESDLAENSEDSDITEDEDAEAAEEDKHEKADQKKLYEKGLEKTNKGFGAKLNAFFAKFRTVDEDFFDDLEDLLIESDVGYQTAEELTEQLRDEAKLQKAKTRDELKQVIVEKLVALYDQNGNADDEKLIYHDDQKPNVYLFVGVNGAGKTTTIGKLAKRFKDQGKSVLMAAADTFRAGAVEQLVEWGKRVDVPVVTGKEKADPASVVYDATKKALDEGYDYLLVDTAGRLQNKKNLMNELEKIQRTIKKLAPEEPTETLLVLDGSTGQNALLQAKDFDKTTKLTGLVLTKLDGSSKGGVVLAIRNEMKLPVKLVGLGEKAEDLADFDAANYAIGLFHGLV